MKATILITLLMIVALLVAACEQQTLREEENLMDIDENTPEGLGTSTAYEEPTGSGESDAPISESGTGSVQGAPTDSVEPQVRME